MPQGDSGSLEQLQASLGKVDGIASLNRAVGRFVDANAPASSDCTEADLEAEIVIRGALGIKLDLGLSIENDGHDLVVEAEEKLAVSKVVDALLAEFKVGLYVQAGAKAKGDDGLEIADYIALGMLPAIEATSASLAAWLYGDTADFTAKATEQMDKNDTSLKTDDDEADGVEVSVGAGLVAGFKTEEGMEIEGEGKLGVKHTDYLSRDGSGRLRTDSKAGVAYALTLQVADTEWEVAFDGTSGELSLSSAANIDRPDNRVLDLYVSGALVAAAKLVDLVASDPRRGKGGADDAALAMLRAKLAATSAMAIESIQPGLASVSVKAELTSTEKGVDFTVTVFNVLAAALEADVGVARVDAETELRVGTVLIDMGL